MCRNSGREGEGESALVSKAAGYTLSLKWVGLFLGLNVGMTEYQAHRPATAPTRLVATNERF